MARAAADTGLRPPRAYPDAVALLRLYAGVAQTLRRLDPAVYAASPDRLAAAMGDGAGLSFLDRRALRKQARALATGPAEPSRRRAAPGAPRGRRPSWPSGAS